MNKLFKDFGKKVKKYRKAKGYSTSEIAGRLGVSVGLINNIENGKTDTFKLELLVNLSKELDIPINTFLKSTPIEIKHLIINSHSTNVIIDQLDHISDETISYIVHHINILNSYFIDSISQHDYSKESIETISNHIIEQFHFIEKMNSLTETNPAV
ncbi:MAG: helix-turn-helix domain-containing protein [Marinisporobacter sp.]|jgi:transcriptional regulator with XRE-family HTH domain|nr:helix-turn-helix domain-containing protein [Marinisporobacter sp.]